MSQSVQLCLDSRQRVFALVTAMAGMVEGSVDQGMQSLVAGDRGLAQAVLQGEIMVNRMETHVDAAILEHLTHKNLSPEDLRSMLSILKINKNLERMGDLAANVARKVMELARNYRDCADLQPMAIAVSHLCRKALRALVRRDLVLAESALGGQEQVHTYRDYVFQKIRGRLVTDSSDVNSDLALLLASGYLEQIAGQAAQLADNLVFWMRGKAQEKMLA